MNGTSLCVVRQIYMYIHGGFVELEDFCLFLLFMLLLILDKYLMSARIIFTCLASLLVHALGPLQSVGLGRDTTCFQLVI